jgi:hypothetical protein
MEMRDKHGEDAKKKRETAEKLINRALNELA